MPFSKQTRVDISRAIDALRLVLLDDERERPRFLTASDRGALSDARAVLQEKLLADAGRELARVG